MRRGYGKKVHEDAENVRKKTRRPDRDENSSSKQAERKLRRDQEKTSSMDRCMIVRKKRVDSERTSDNSVCKEDKPSRDAVKRGHHSSAVKNSNRSSSVEKKVVKDNTMSRHQRQYLTSEEMLASQSNASLLSVVKQEGNYEAKEKTRRSSDRKTRKKVAPPPDHPYNNYDSTSERHLRREKKRLKYPKLTSFSDMGKSTRGSRHGSHKAKARSAPDSTHALVLRSESRRESAGVSTIVDLLENQRELQFMSWRLLSFIESPVCLGILDSAAGAYQTMLLFHVALIRRSPPALGCSQYNCGL
jgi:hypothetical protein